MSDEKKLGVRGPGRTRREDWLTAAMHTLIREGVDQVKVLALANALDCLRSSFYWYFKNRAELLDALLEHWESTNTKALIAATKGDEQTICAALSKLFADWVSGSEFDNNLDFAIRDWARRSDAVRRALDNSDNARIRAIGAMFQRHGYDPHEADVRARIVYFTQIGYATLDQREDWTMRMARGASYLYCMTGQHPTPTELAEYQLIAPQESA